MSATAITIRKLEVADLPDVVDLSLRAWAPVFASLRAELGDAIFLRLPPDWEAGQAEAIKLTCTSGERDVCVAVHDRPPGFVAVALDAYQPSMGAVDMIAVDPEYQRRGIARQLLAFTLDHMRRSGMDISLIETGGGPGHAPARRTYASSGSTLLPVARSFHLLRDQALASRLFRDGSLRALEAWSSAWRPATPVRCWSCCPPTSRP